MAHINYKEIANSKVSSRFKQAVVLVVVILIGILLSFAFGDFRPPN